MLNLENFASCNRGVVITNSVPFLYRLLIPLFNATSTTNDVEYTLVLVLALLDDFVTFIVSNDARTLEYQIPITSI
jgi:hypothetical protein